MNSLRRFSLYLRRSCNTLMLRTLSRLSVSLLSCSESSLRQKIWEEWQARRPMQIRLPLSNSSDQEPLVSLEVTPGQRDRLKELMGTGGWEVLSRQLDQLSLEVSEYLRNAESPEDFRYRKGFLDGHNRTRNLINVLLSLGEESEAEWMSKELERALEPFRAVTLRKGQDQQEQEEVLARVSRVMAARRAELSSTGENSTQP